MRFLVVEDEREYADALRRELTAFGHEATVVHSGVEVLVAVGREGFDAIVLDRMLPRMSGTTVVRRLREEGQAMPVLMLSAKGRADDRIEGLDAGADDYVVKPAAAAEIVARLRALVRARQWGGRGGGRGEETLRVGDIVVSPGQHRAWRAGRTLDLARLEFALLVELARHAGSVLTRAMLVERVWGYDFEPTTNIVDAQIRSLRRKLTASGEADPIVTRRGVGYMLGA